MKYNQSRRLIRAFYAATASVTLLTGFTSLAAESDVTDSTVSSEMLKTAGLLQETKESNGEIQNDILSGRFDVTDPDSFWNFTEIVNEVHAEAVSETKEAAEAAKEAYLKKIEEEKKAAEEAKRLAEEKAAQEAAAAQAEKEAQAQAEQAQASSAVNASASEQELLAALIFCEAGNQPYDGQVAVGAVVMNRVRSGSFPDTITDVIYQSGQFTPAMTGWLDSVLASDGYTDSAMQAAADALSGSNPIGDCLYFSTGGGGYQLGDHYFR